MFLTLELGKELRLLDLVWRCGFVFLFVLVSSLIISKRLGASDPFILLQSLRNLKKKGGAVKTLVSLDFLFHSLMVHVFKYLYLFCFLDKNFTKG